MSPENEFNWNAVVSLCVDGTVHSINVASNQRRVAVLAADAELEQLQGENAAFRALFDSANPEATAALKANILRGLNAAQVAALVRSLMSDEQKRILDAAVRGENDGE